MENEQFKMLWDAVTEEVGISASGVFSTIYGLAQINDGKYCKTNIETIAKYAHLSVRTTFRCITKLIENGYLTISKKSRSNNTYFITDKFDRNSHYITVLDSIIENVGYSEACVFGVVNGLSKMDSKNCTASVETIAKFSHLSIRTTQRSLQNLVKNGYLKVYVKNNVGNIYYPLENSLAVQLAETLLECQNDTPTEKLDCQNVQMDCQNVQMNCQFDAMDCQFDTQIDNLIYNLTDNVIDNRINSTSNSLINNLNNHHLTNNLINSKSSLNYNLNNHQLTNNLINSKSFDENLNSGDGNINYKTHEGTLNKREDGENEMAYVNNTITDEEVIKLAHAKLGDNFTAGTKWALTKYPAGWVRHAINLAVQNKAKSFNYIKAVLEAWEVDGFPGGEAGDPIMKQYEDALFYTGVKPTLRNIKLLKQSPAELNKNIKELKQAGAYLPYITSAERLLELIAINNAGEPLPENAMLKTTSDDVVTDMNIIRKYLKSTPNIIG